MHRNPNKVRRSTAAARMLHSTELQARTGELLPMHAWAAAQAACCLSRPAPCCALSQWYEIVAWWWHVLARTLIGVITGAASCGLSSSKWAMQTRVQAFDGRDVLGRSHSTCHA